MSKPNGKATPTAPGTKVAEPVPTGPIDVAEAPPPPAPDAAPAGEPTATGCTALAAVVVGTALGTPLAHWLIDAQGRSSGIGAGIAHGPSPVLLLLFGAAAVLGATALAAVPATRAARRRLADTLSSVT